MNQIKENQKMFKSRIPLLALIALNSSVPAFAQVAGGIAPDHYTNGPVDLLITPVGPIGVALRVQKNAAGADVADLFQVEYAQNGMAMFRRMRPTAESPTLDSGDVETYEATNAPTRLAGGREYPGINLSDRQNQGRSERFAPVMGGYRWIQLTAPLARDFRFIGRSERRQGDLVVEANPGQPGEFVLRISGNRENTFVGTYSLRPLAPGFYQIRSVRTSTMTASGTLNPEIIHGVVNFASRQSMDLLRGFPIVRTARVTWFNLQDPNSMPQTELFTE